MPPLHWIALLLLGLGYTLALIHGSIDLVALPALLALLCSALLARRPVRWQQSLGHLLFIVLAVALALHWLPGFHGARVIDKAVLSEGAVPFSMYLNLDKPLIGLWLLLACPWLVMLRGRGLAISLALILPLTLLACLGGAWVLGMVAWAPKWPDQAWLWLANNLLLVSLTEELLFRGYIQGSLQRLFKHEGWRCWWPRCCSASRTWAVAGSGSTWPRWPGWDMVWPIAMAGWQRRSCAIPASTWRTSPCSATRCWLQVEQSVMIRPIRHHL